MSMSFLWDWWDIARSDVGGLLGTEQSREKYVTGLVDKGVTGLTNMGVPESVFEFAPSTTEPNLIASADRFAENIPAHIPKFTKGLLELGMNPVETTKIAHGLLEGGISNLADTFYDVVLPDEWYEKYLSWKPESSQGEAMASEVGSAFATQMSTEQGRRDAFQQHPLDWLLAWTMLPKNVLGKIPKKQYEGILSKIDETFPQPLGSQVTHWHGNPYGQKYVDFDFNMIGTGTGVQKEAWGMNISQQKETGLYFASQGITGGVDPALKRIYRGKLESHLTPIERFIWGEAELGKLPQDVEALARKKYPEKVYWENQDGDEINHVIKQFEKIHDDSMAQLYKLDLHDDKVKLMISQEKPMIQQPLNVQKLMKNSVLGKVPSTTTGREFYDMLAEHFVEITGGAGARKAASLYLLENGVPGMSYLDDVTRTDWKINDGLLTQQGEKKISHTVFDNSSHTMLERQGQDVIKDKMIAQHNLGEDALLKHLEAGGDIPMPSMAVSKAINPVENFGEFSLLGDAGLITPSSKTKTYPADMYSGRAPHDRVKYKDPEAVFNSLDPQELQWHLNLTSRNWLEDTTLPPEELDVMGLKWGTVKDKKVDYSTSVGQDYLRRIKEKFLTIDPGQLERQMINVEKMKKLGYNMYDFENYRHMVVDVSKEMEDTTTLDLFSSPTIPESEMLGETTRMMTNPKGYRTPTGKKRADVPYDPETALKVMRKKKAYEVGAENYEGSGQTRALLSSPFKNLEEIKANRDLLVERGEGYGFKEEFSEARKNANEEIRKYARLSYNDREMVNNMIEDILRTGEMSWFYRDKVDQSVRGEVGKEHIESIVDALKQKGKDLHTDYFESKANRLVNLSEFKGAIIPKETPKYIEELLKDVGIQKILRYGSHEERIKLFRKFPELMFAGMAIPTGGLLSTQDNEEGKLYGGLLK